MKYRNYALKLFEITASSLVSCVTTWQLKARNLNITKFTLQNSIWLILILRLSEAKWVNKSFGGAETKNTYEPLSLYFYPLSFLADEPDLRHIYNFTELFEVSLEWK